MSGINRYDASMKVWVADNYGLPFHEIARVAFDVQEAPLSIDDAPELQLEIDVRTTDGNRHLFTREACDFGKIVDEVAARRLRFTSKGRIPESSGVAAAESPFLPSTGCCNGGQSR